MKKKTFKVPRTISEVSELDEEKEEKKHYEGFRNPESMKKKNKDENFFK